MQFRHEYKFILNHSEYIELRNKLRTILDTDSNTNINGEYIVHSLYFDNLYDKALNEKINGVNNREKFRIRFYNNDYSFIKLEKKTKVNGMTYKISTPISKEECERIINNELNWMIHSDRELIKELYVKMKTQLLKPKTIVEYIREPFVYEKGNVRITLDRNIRTSINSIDLFSANTIPVGSNEIILEVKYDDFLPGFIKNIVNLKNKNTIAFSKYAQCRIYN